MTRALSSIFFGLLVGCAPVQAHIDTSSPAEDPSVEARFEGIWLVEETVAHATYFASAWTFQADGSLTLVEDYSIGGELVYPWVSWSGGAYIECELGDRWSSADDVRLRIEGACNDGQGRSIELSFDEHTALDTQGIEPLELAVDGDDTMWSPPIWGWRFIKCEDDHSNCDPWRP